MTNGSTLPSSLALPSPAATAPAGRVVICELELPLGPYALAVGAAALPRRGSDSQARPSLSSPSRPFGSLGSWS
jgi:hypothetical protein